MRVVGLLAAAAVAWGALPVRAEDSHEARAACKANLERLGEI